MSLTYGQKRRDELREEFLAAPNRCPACCEPLSSDMDAPEDWCSYECYFDDHKEEFYKAVYELLYAKN